jgi:hypothetical protein
MLGVELRLRLGKGDGGAKVGELLVRVHLLPRCTLGSAEAAVVVIEHAKTGLGE